MIAKWKRGVKGKTRNPGGGFGTRCMGGRGKGGEWIELKEANEVEETTKMPTP